MAIWSPIIRVIAKAGAKISARIGAKTAAKTAGKTVINIGARTAGRRLGLGIGIGAIGAFGLSNYIGTGSILPSLDSLNPLSEDFNLILFAIIAIVLIAFFAKFRK